MSQTPPQPAPAWRVTAQQETVRPGANGSFTRGVTVMFTTAKGNSASVFVPDTQYSPALVRDLIAAKAADLDATSNLTG